jgi:hypothetical protein
VPVPWAQAQTMGTNTGTITKIKAQTFLTGPR